MATRIVVLRGGTIEQVGTPYELYNFPRNQFVATFIGSPKMNIVAASHNGSKATLPDFGAITLPLATIKPGPIAVGIRPEQFAIGTVGDATARGTISLVEYLGSEIFLYVKLASGQTVLVQASGKAQHKLGETLDIAFTAQNAHYFDADGQRLGMFD